MRSTISLTFLSMLIGVFATLAQENAQPKAIFDSKADAKADLQKAQERAKKNNRRVLIHWGEDSSEWCVLLHKSFATAPLSRKRLYEYEWINVAAGPLSADLAKKLQTPLVDGVPCLTILDSDGKVLASQRAEPFQIKNESGQKLIDTKKLIEFLTKHEAKPLVATKVLQEGLDLAAKTDKLVFLHFGAPWCGWCHRLEDWMALPEIAPILDKEFVDVLIDIDRMEGGKQILERFNTTGKGGIPWFAFVDSKGKALANSDSPKGNIGHPYAEHEIDHFVKMLNTTRRHLQPAEIEKLDRSLRDQKKLGK